MRSKVVERLMANMPLETELRVSTEMSFINLLTELGFREDKMWTPDEDELLSKLMKLAHELTDDNMKHIEKWVNEGCKRPLKSKKK